MNTYKRHRFPPDTISCAVWLYYRFNLSERDIEDLLAGRVITVTRESIRLWSVKFGAIYIRRLKRNHRGYVETFYIDDGSAAKQFFKRLLRSHGSEPGKIVTDKLRSYGVARRELTSEMIHSTKEYENNRAEQSHEVTRVRERGMRKFKLIKQVQLFLGAHATDSNLFNPGRYKIRAHHCRDLRVSAFTEWKRAVP